MKPYRCAICSRWIEKEARTNPKPSAGDHDSGEHVRRAYGTDGKGGA